MNGWSDQDLLRAYADERSEAAFTELVRRHIDHVHSTALRLARDPHIAEDVTQSVFAALAASARQLRQRNVLAGWLHFTTRNLAAKSVRTEVRRRTREQEAVAMNEPISNPESPAWEQVAPHLDEALGELDEADRDALLLRYFQRKPAREIAGILGLSEEAAQKRLSRALDKLRGIFAARGVALSTTALATFLGMQAVSTAPAALTAAVATLSATAATLSTLNLLTHMTSAKLKLGLGAIVAAGLITPLVLQHNQLKQLRGEHAALLEHQGELDALRAENERLSRQLAANSAPTNDQPDRLELLRLRGEITRLATELRQQTAARTSARQTNNAAREKPLPPALLSYSGVGVATVPSGATFATGGWQTAEGRRAFLFVTPTLTPQSTQNTGGQSVLIQTKLLDFAEEDLTASLRQKIALVKNGGNSSFLNFTPTFSHGDADFEALKNRIEAQGGNGVAVVSSPTVLTRDGVQAKLAVGQEQPVMTPDGSFTNQFIGTAIDLVPKVAPDGQIKVEAMISFVPPNGPAVAPIRRDVPR